MEPAPPWSDLPGDELREIAGYLRDANDAVRFRAVCRPWREAATEAPNLLPWLITPNGFATSTKMHIRSPLSGKSVSLGSFPPNRRRRLQGCDAANGRLFASSFFVDDGTDSLVNPLTGEVTAAPWATRPPPRCRSFRSPNGIFDFYNTSSFEGEICDYLLAKGRDACFGDVAGVPEEGATADLERQPGRDRHLLVFRGELLCVDVVDIQPWLRRPSIWDKLELVSVHALRQVRDHRWPRWVRRDTSHLCLFLGWESSFAIDAGDFDAGTGMTGGCAYFVGRRAAGMKGFAVFRYSFQDRTAKMVDALPVHFEKKSMWLMPRPRLAAVRDAHK